MQIQGGFSNLQRIQAQQAFTPKDRVQEQQQTQTSAADVHVPARPAPSQNIGANLQMAEIKSIAAQAGYIGLTDADIQHAYAYGESLLSDYTV